MLTEYQGARIVITQNALSLKWTAHWYDGGAQGAPRCSVPGFESEAAALAYARARIDAYTAITVHKTQKREPDGDVLWAS